MDEGSKEAFCILLWAANGGQITASGTFDGRTVVRGVCSDPHDCYTCPLMQAELANHRSEEIFWLCSGCVRDAVKEAKVRGTSFALPGYFTEGQCQYPTCPRTARVEEGIELPERYSRFLQLFIGALT